MYELQLGKAFYKRGTPLIVTAVIIDTSVTSDTIVTKDTI